MKFFKKAVRKNAIILTHSVNLCFTKKERKDERRNKMLLIEKTVGKRSFVHIIKHVLHSRNLALWLHCFAF